jgi:hypothetical protein
MSRHVIPFFFVTGVSGVRKSTALRQARDMDDAQARFCLRDIDEAGVPTGVDLAWRRE